MEQFLNIAEKIYKPVIAVAGGILGLIVLYMAGYSLSAASALAGGWYTFVYVIYWIALIALILGVAFIVVKKLLSSNITINSTQNQNYTAASAPVNNAQAAGEKICPVCGAKVAPGNAFCNSCGNKMN